MIELENVTKKFRVGLVETTALDSVRLRIAAGEFVAIMGPSGSGKSTLLNLLGLLDRPTSGEYRLLGRPVSRLSERHLARERKASISFVFQSFNLIDELTVAENVEMPLGYRRLGRAERRRRVDEALDRVGMAHRAGHRPNELSGGQQQRVAVARAVVTSPHLILADEPTGNLDSENGRQVMALFDELHRNGTTVVMVTHSDAHARFAGRRVELFDGRVVASSAEMEEMASA